MSDDEVQQIKPIVDMEGLIDHLQNIIRKRFSSRVAATYFGDIGIYPPKLFGTGDRATQKAIVALSPAYNYLKKGEKVASHEYRLLGVDIIIMVNLTPYFEVNPTEAIGERKLVELTTEIAEFLTQQANEDLGGRVSMTSVGDIDWSWMQRSTTSIRAAGISYEARVKVARM